MQHCLFCIRPFSLHRQQPEKDEQNVNFAPPLEKFLRTPMVNTSFTYSNACIFHIPQCQNLAWAYNQQVVAGITRLCTPLVVTTTNLMFKKNVEL